MATEYFNDAWRIPNNKNQSLVSNYSMQFDGSSNFVDLDNTSDFLNIPYGSFSFWFYPKTTTSSSQYLLSCNRTSGNASTSWSMVIQNQGAVSGKARINFRADGHGNNNYSGYDVNLNQWNHYVAVKPDATSGNTQPIFYINGQISTGGTPNSGPNFSYSNITVDKVYIGRLAHASVLASFDGLIDQVSIFNYALPATGTNSVATLYGGGTAVTNPMSLSPKPIYYAQLGDQSVDNGANYLVPNNSLQDYVFKTATATSSYFTIPTITISSTATISIWVNIEFFVSSNAQVLFGGDVNNRITINKEGTNVRVVYVSNGGLGLKTTNLLASDFTNKWHHIALVQNGAAATLYINNVDKGVLSGTSRTPDFTNIAAINTGQFAINGLISNAAIFSTNLPATGTESIASLYNNGTPPDLTSYSNLQRWYKLNAEDVFTYPNWVIRDSAGSNDGASVNMTSANLVQSNLQLGVGFSPYAFELDGTSQYFNCGTELANFLGNGVTNFSFSGWYTAQSSASNEGLFGIGDGTTNIVSLTQGNFGTRVVTIGSTTSRFFYDSRSQWANFIVVVSGDGNSPLTLKYYHDGVELINQNSPNFPNSLDFSGNNAYIGNNTNLLRFFKGEISNFSFFNFALTSTQVTELNNNQRTSNLNNLSFAKPLAWWQLGSNSSFNSGTWTALNEGTVSGGDAVSTANMAEDDIVNGVGYTGNGLGTSSIEIVGDAPYSTANGISVNMDVLDRTTDVPS